MKKIGKPDVDNVFTAVSVVDDNFPLDAGWYELPLTAEAGDCYLSGGVVLEYPQAVKDLYHSPRPGPTYVWSVGTLQWVDTRSLSDYKQSKITSIKKEAVTRMAAILPDLDSFGAVVTLKELWLSIAPAARQPTAKMTQVINIYQAASDGVAAVKAATTKAAVDAVTVTWPT